MTKNRQPEAASLTFYCDTRGWWWHHEGDHEDCGEDHGPYATRDLAVAAATGKTDGASEKDRALTALCDTLDATGGLVRDDSGLLVPAGDEDWNDLGEAYLLACHALGREPKIEGEEQ